MKRELVLFLAVQLCVTIAVAQKFTIKSNDIRGGLNVEQVANVYGCKGRNISPRLQWQGAPSGTKAYAVTVFDKDAPRAGGFWHWVVYNIPVTDSGLKADASSKLPVGAVNGLNDAGSYGYVGPCPPKGQRHEYIVTVYALKTKLKGLKNAKAADLASLIMKNSYAKASFSFFYKQ